MVHLFFCHRKRSEAKKLDKIGLITDCMKHKYEKKLQFFIMNFEKFLSKLDKSTKHFYNQMLFDIRKKYYLNFFLN